MTIFDYCNNSSNIIFTCVRISCDYYYAQLKRTRPVIPIGLFMIMENSFNTRSIGFWNRCKLISVVVRLNSVLD